MKLSVVIPVYNGEQTLNLLNEDLFSFFNEQTYDYEVVYVYDCGDDNSWDELLKLKKKFNEKITLVHLSRNYGQHNALIAGFEVATGDYIVTMDEDLQHLPTDIEKLLVKQAEDDYDVVYGSYFVKKHKFIRNITSNLLRKLLSIAIPELHQDYSAYRLLKASVAKHMLEMRNSYTFLDGYISWITNHIESVQVEHKERKAGNSSYSFKKLIKHSINIFVTFSDLPIRLLTYSSFLVFILTIIYTICLIARKLLYNDLMQGYPSLIITIGFGMSLILLGLGVIGEYIYRNNLKTTKRPSYIIKKKI